MKRKQDCGSNYVNILTMYSANKKSIDFFERTGRWSRIDTMLDQFILNIYKFMNGNHISGLNTLIYEQYTRIIDLTYFPNEENMSRTLYRGFHIKARCALYRDYSSEYSFIELRDYNQYTKMKQVIDLIFMLGDKPEFYGYISELKFKEILLFIRKRFQGSKGKDTLNYNIGKWPKQLRRRQLKTKGQI